MLTWENTTGMEFIESTLTLLMHNTVWRLKKLSAFSPGKGTYQKVVPSRLAFKRL